MRAMEPRESLTALDGIAVLLAIGAIVTLASFGVIGSTFAAMYADFGGHIPWLSLMVTRPYVPPLLALPAIALLIAAARTRAIGHRRLAIAGSFGLALVGIVVCYVGAYLPIYQLADAVR
jgi:hypothetical protein